MLLFVFPPWKKQEAGVRVERPHAEGACAFREEADSLTFSPLSPLTETTVPCK